MATYNGLTLDTDWPVGPSGKVFCEVMQITGNGSGGTAVAASVLRMGEIPRGVKVIDVVCWPSAATASLTLKAGYTDVEADAGNTDDDAFFAATAAATAGARVSMNTALGPREFAKPAYLDLVTAGATIAADTVIYAMVWYTNVGLS